MSSNTNSQQTVSRGADNVTNLDEVRQARAVAKRTKATDTAVKDDTQSGPSHVPGDIANENTDSLLADSADNRHGNRRFDAEKVARLKAEIASGEYKINPASIAQRFIEHDRNQ